MKAARVSTVGVIMVAVVSSWFMTVHAGPSLWPSNKGEVCLQNTTTGQLARFAVERSVGNHYSVHGYVTEGERKTLFSGNAIVDGGSVLMNVSSSGWYIAPHNAPYGETYGSVNRVELNAADLSGWVVGVGFHCVGDPALDDCAFGNDGRQELVLAACP